jgi:hypothetical protein
VALEDVGLDLEVAVVGPQPGSNRFGVLVAVVDGRLLEGEQVEAGDVIGLLDRAQDGVQLQPEVEVPGAEAEPRRGCAGDGNKGNKVVGLT